MHLSKAATAIYATAQTDDRYNLTHAWVILTSNVDRFHCM